MARLPTTIEQQAPNGSVARGTAVDFSGLDNALQGVAREVQRFDEARKAADDEVAGRILQTRVAEYNAAATERWAAYDGRTLGQDAAEMAEFDRVMAPLADDPNLSDGERDSLRRGVTRLRSEYNARAMATAAEVRARRVSNDRDAAERVSARDVMLNVLQRWQPIEDEVRNSWDATTDIAADLAPRWRELMEEGLAPHPPAVQARARELLVDYETRMMMNAMHGQDQARDAVIATTATTAASRLVNLVSRQPALFATFQQEINAIAESLPALARPAFIAEQTERGAAVHIDARLAAGDVDGVTADIEAGRFDFLSPETLATARGKIAQRANDMTLERALQSAEITARHTANLAAIARGEEPDPSVLADAAAALPPEEVAQMLLAQQAAQRQQPFVQELRRLTAGQAEAAMTALEANATTEGERTALAAIRRAKDEDFALRASAPGEWAITPAGPADTVRTNIRTAWQAFQSDPTADRARTFATATLLAQGEAHIAAERRQILPPEAARELVAGLDAPGADAAENLRRLAGTVNTFTGNYRARVLVELSQAGMTNRALGAMMHYVDQPQMMQRYAAGLAVASTSRNAALEDALNDELADYERTVATGQGLEASRAAARTVAQALVAQGESPREAARIATRPIVGEYLYGDTFAVPVSANARPRDVEEGAARYLGNLMSAGLEGLSTAPIPGFTREQAERVHRDRIRAGQWVINADDTGIIFMQATEPPSALALADGTPVQLTWAEAVRQAQERPDRGAMRHLN